MIALPPPESLLQAVRDSCAACTARSSILIDREQVDAFILGIDERDWTPSDHGVRLPLAFESVDDELNVLATIALLNFLSGYRHALHRLTGRGAYSTILSLVLAAYLSSAPDASVLSASGMAAVTVAQLADLARISTHTERQHPTLPVQIGEKDADAFEILELLVGVLRETGAVLHAQGCRSLGVWLRAALNRADGHPGALVHELASTFPAFRDVHAVDGEPVYLFKKALWLATVVSLRFESETVPFKVPSLQGMPVFADNVLPTLLIHHRILSLPTSALPALSSLSLSDPSTLALSTDSATRLRAASVTAGAALVVRAHELSLHEGKAWLSSWTEQRLDGWLWERAKGPALCEVERVAERGTVYY
ncbi:hypothetical protein JCM3770_002860 [Rhodotorula araucariae]